MPHTFGDVACIKASRLPGNPPVLTFERVRRNQSEGIGTQLVPDCNVIIDMIRAAGSDDQANTHRARNRLAPLLAFLRECSHRGLTYYVSPLFGLDEMRSGEALNGISLLDVFDKHFGLGWIEAHPEHPVPDQVGITTRGSFCTLDLDRQVALSPSFSSLLLALVVRRDLAVSAPLAKFRHFLRLYHRLINVVSIRDVTIARFLFAPPAIDESLREIQDNIVRNFGRARGKKDHWPETPAQLEQTALNGAFDLHLLNTAIVSDHCGVNGQPVDTWILTADSKLAALTDAVHHSALGTGQTGKYVVTEDYRHHGYYWRETHRDIEKLNQSVREDLKPSFLRQHARAFGVLALAEQGLRGDRSAKGFPLRHSRFPREHEDRPGIRILPSWH